MRKRLCCKFLQHINEQQHLKVCQQKTEKRTRWHVMYTSCFRFCFCYFASNTVYSWVFRNIVPHFCQLHNQSLFCQRSSIMLLWWQLWWDCDSPPLLCIRWASYRWQIWSQWCQTQSTRACSSFWGKRGTQRTHMFFFTNTLENVLGPNLSLHMSTVLRAYGVICWGWTEHILKLSAALSHLTFWMCQLMTARSHVTTGQSSIDAPQSLKVETLAMAAWLVWYWTTES